MGATDGKVCVSRVFRSDHQQPWISAPPGAAFPVYGGRPPKTPKKAALFSVEERMEIIRRSSRICPGSGSRRSPPPPPFFFFFFFFFLCAIKFTKLRGARAVIRGLRAVSVPV